MRLSSATAVRLPSHVVPPGYDRAAMQRGIVHLGIGAFHRAHQAVYTDLAMASGDRDWAITGVSLRSGAVQHMLAPQDGLFTVTERSSAHSETRLVGAVREVLVTPHQRESVIAALADPATQVVTLTVTEKGYCRTPDGSPDWTLADQPDSIYTVLKDAMEQRRTAGVAGLSLVSCDNLAGNGAVLRTVMQAYLDRSSPGLAAWFESECACPSSMVDRIVPAPEADWIEQLERDLGVRDEAAIATEPYRQWVIEDRFAGPRPRWETGGAQFVADVAPYEDAKLRMLNGAHSALAYLGLSRGHEYVHEAIADPALRPVVQTLMHDEAARTIDVAPGQDLSAYAEALLGRFANSALPHKLAQIAIDGSQKIGPRWLSPLSINAVAGRSCPATLEALAEWIVYVRGDAGPVNDPLADQLAVLWRKAGRGGIAGALFGPAGLFAASWTASEADLSTLDRYVTRAV